MTSRIKIVQESEASGELAAQYKRLREAFEIPFVPDVFKPASLRPDFVGVLADGFEAMFLRGELPRPVKEAIATIVSHTNSCQYCTKAHSYFMVRFGESQESAQAASEGHIDSIPVDAKYRPLLHLAVKITEHAYRVTDEDFDGLRAAGLTDAEILEGVFVACLFNAINRFADTFGVYELMQLKEA